MVSGGVVVTQPGGEPAHRVEDVGLPHRLIKSAEDAQSVEGVLERPLVVSSLLPHPGEDVVSVSLLGEIAVAFRQGKGFAQMADGLFVLPQ